MAASGSLVLFRQKSKHGVLWYFYNCSCLDETAFVKGQLMNSDIYIYARKAIPATPYIILVLTYFIPFILAFYIEYLFDFQTKSVSADNQFDIYIEVIWRLQITVYAIAIGYFLWLRFVLKFEFTLDGINIIAFSKTIKKIPKENIELNYEDKNSILIRLHGLSNTVVSTYQLYIPDLHIDSLRKLTSQYFKSLLGNSENIQKKSMRLLLRSIKVASIFSLILVTSFYMIFRDQSETFAIYGALKEKPSIIIIGYILGHKMNDEIRGRKQNEGGVNLVFVAVAAQKNGALDFIVKMGGDINFIDKTDGRTPIFYAIKNHDTKMIQYLLKRGADVTIKNNSGITPVQFADQVGCSDCFK